MKNVTKETPKPGTTKNVHYNVSKQRPEIRDDLDSRKGEEQHFKGNDITHNHKSHHSTKHASK